MKDINTWTNTNTQTDNTKQQVSVQKDTFIQIFPNSENFGVPFSTTAIYSKLGSIFFYLFLFWKKKMKNRSKTFR